MELSNVYCGPVSVLWFFQKYSVWHRVYIDHTFVDYSICTITKREHDLKNLANLYITIVYSFNMLRWQETGIDKKTKNSTVKV